MLHIAGLRWTAPIQPGSVPPFGVEFDAIGRVADHQQRLAVAQQPSHGLWTDRIPAEYPMLFRLVTAKPSVTETRCRDLGQGGTASA
jgi:hypothetical protein